METTNLKVFVWTIAFALAIIIAGCISPTMSTGSVDAAAQSEDAQSFTTLIVEQDGQQVEDFESKDVHIRIIR